MPLKTVKRKRKEYVRCCVPGCHRFKRNFKDLYFHFLPENEDVVQQWLDRIGNSELANKPLTNVRVCGRHFEKNAFVDTRNRVLKSGAVPVLYMSPSKRKKKCAGTFYVLNNCLTPKLFTKPTHLNATCASEDQTHMTTDSPDTVCNSFAIEFLDFKKICRICLLETEDLISVDCEFIRNMLVSCPTFTFNENLTYPRQICAACVSELKIVYNFSRKYEHSNVVLQNCADRSKNTADLTYSAQMQLNYVPKDTERFRSAGRDFDYLMASGELQKSDSNVLGSKVAVSDRNTCNKKNNYAIESSSSAKKTTVPKYSFGARKKTDIENSMQKNVATENSCRAQLQTTAENNTANTDDNSTRHTAIVTDNKSADQIPLCRKPNCTKTNSPKNMPTYNNNFVEFQRVSRKRKLNETQQACANRPCVAVVPMQKCEKRTPVDEEITEMFKQTNSRQEEMQSKFRECFKSTAGAYKTVEDHSKTVAQNANTPEANSWAGNGLPKNVEIPQTFEDAQIPEQVPGTVADTIVKKKRIYCKKTRTSNRLKIRTKLAKNNPNNAVTEYETNNKYSGLNAPCYTASRDSNEPVNSKINTDNNNESLEICEEKLTNFSRVNLNSKSTGEKVLVPDRDTACLEKKSDLTGTNLGVCRSKVLAVTRNQNEESSTEASNSLAEEREIVQTKDQCNGMNIPNVIIETDELKHLLKVRVDLSKEKLQCDSKSYHAEPSEGSKDMPQELLASNRKMKRLKRALRSDRKVSDSHMNACKTIKFGVIHEEETNSSGANDGIGIKSGKIWKLNESAFGVVDENSSSGNWSLDISSETSGPVNSAADQNETDRCNLSNCSEDIIVPIASKLSEGYNRGHAESNLVEDCYGTERSETSSNGGKQQDETSILLDLNCEFFHDYNPITSSPIFNRMSLDDANENLSEENDRNTDISWEHKQNTALNGARHGEESITANLLELLNEFVKIPRQNATTVLPSDSGTSVSAQEQCDLQTNNATLLYGSSDLPPPTIDPFINLNAMLSDGQDLFNESLPLETADIITVGDEIPLYDNFMQSMDNFIGSEYNSVYGGQLIGSEVELSTENGLAEMDVDVKGLQTEATKLLNTPIQCELPVDKTKVAGCFDETGIPQGHRLCPTTEPTPCQDSREEIQEKDVVRSATVVAPLSSVEIESVEHCLEENDDEYTDTWPPTEQSDTLGNTRGKKFENCNVLVLKTAIQEEHRLLATTEPTPYQHGREEIQENNAEHSATVVAPLSRVEIENLECCLAEENGGEYTDTWPPTEQTDTLGNTRGKKFENCNVLVLEDPFSRVPRKTSPSCTLVSGDFPDTFPTTLNETPMPNLQYTWCGDNVMFTVMPPKQTGLEETPLQTDNAGSDFGISYTQANVMDTEVPTANNEIPSTSTDLLTPKLPAVSSPMSNGIKVLLIPKSNVPPRKHFAHKCKVCNKGFDTLFKLSCHLINAKHVALTTCKFCRQTVEIDSYKTHLSSHTRAEPLCCEYCGKMCYGKNAFIRHKTRHMWSTTYDCGECGNQYKSLFRLKEHLAVHEQTPFVCQLCSKVFQDRISMDAHAIKKTCQKNKEKYHCPTCKRQFQREDMFRKHIKMHGKVQKSYYKRKKQS